MPRFTLLTPSSVAAPPLIDVATLSKHHRVVLLAFWPSLGLYDRREPLDHAALPRSFRCYPPRPQEAFPLPMWHRRGQQGPIRQAEQPQQTHGCRPPPPYWPVSGRPPCPISPPARVNWFLPSSNRGENRLESADSWSNFWPKRSDLILSRVCT